MTSENIGLESTALENIKQANVMSKSARSNILAKLKSEVAGADYDKLPEEIAFSYPELTRDEQVEQFCQQHEANHALIIKVSEIDIASVLVEQLKQRNIDSLLYGENCPFSLNIKSIEDSVDLTAYNFSIDANKEALFNDYPAAISSSRCAISATGSIVLWPDENEPRTLSLVPPVHFVIVDANNLYPDFSTLIKAQQWQNELPTNVVFISGPSKTADIQQTLAYGAHGPKELIVLLLNS